VSSIVLKWVLKWVLKCIEVYTRNTTAGMKVCVCGEIIFSPEHRTKHQHTLKAQCMPHMHCAGRQSPTHPSWLAT
jgi:hypothetical protein